MYNSKYLYFDIIVFVVCGRIQSSISSYIMKISLYVALCNSFSDSSYSKYTYIYIGRNKMKKNPKTFHSTEIISKSNIKIVKRGKIDTHNILIHHHSTSWLGIFFTLQLQILIASIVHRTLEIHIIIESIFRLILQ